MVWLLASSDSDSDSDSSKSEACLSLDGLDGPPSTTPNGLFVGARVQVRADVNSPKHGWGSVTHGMVGVLETFDGPGDADCWVNFEGVDSNWCGRCEEMEVAYSASGSEKEEASSGSIETRAIGGCSSPSSAAPSSPPSVGSPQPLSPRCAGPFLSQSLSAPTLPAASASAASVSAAATSPACSSHTSPQVEESAVPASSPSSPPTSPNTAVGSSSSSSSPAAPAPPQTGPQDTSPAGEPGESWEVCYEHREKRWYFQDRRTGASSWVRPPGCTLDIPENAPSDVMVTLPGEDELPEGWHAAFCDRKKRVYYYNYETQERTWNRPGPQPQPQPESQSESQPPRPQLGSLVRFRASISEPRHGWPSERRHADVGKVVDFDCDGDAVVEFRNKPRWVCVVEELEVVEGPQPQPESQPPRPQLGSLVRFRQSISEPRHGWPSERRHADVGTVVDFDCDGDAVVEFRNKPRWVCVVEELEVVEGGPSIGLTEAPEIGASVRFRSGLTGARYGARWAGPGTVRGILGRQDDGWDLQVASEHGLLPYIVHSSDLELVVQASPSTATPASGGPPLGLTEVPEIGASVRFRSGLTRARYGDCFEGPGIVRGLLGRDADGWDLQVTFGPREQIVHSADLELVGPASTSPATPASGRPPIGLTEAPEIGTSVRFRSGLTEARYGPLFVGRGTVRSILRRQGDGWNLEVTFGPFSQTVHSSDLELVGQTSPSTATPPSGGPSLGLTEVPEIGASVRFRSGLTRARYGDCFEGPGIVRGLLGRDAGGWDLQVTFGRREQIVHTSDLELMGEISTSAATPASGGAARGLSEVPAVGAAVRVRTDLECTRYVFPRERRGIAGTVLDIIRTQQDGWDIRVSVQGLEQIVHSGDLELVQEASTSASASASTSSGPSGSRVAADLPQSSTAGPPPVGAIVRWRRDITEPRFSWGTPRVTRDMVGKVVSIIERRDDGHILDIQFPNRNLRVWSTDVEVVDQGQSAQMPRVGSRVRVRASVSSPRYGWASDRRHDDIGEVIGFDEDGDAVVKFTHTNRWICPVEELEVVEGENPPHTPASTQSIRVGDHVRVRQGMSPRFGWGGVSPGDVGRVRSVVEDRTRVDFRGHSGWHGHIDELEVVPGSGPRDDSDDDPMILPFPMVLFESPRSGRSSSNRGSDSDTEPEGSELLEEGDRPTAEADAQGESLPTCKICYDRKANTAIDPCGHLACSKCLKESRRNRPHCPFCRKPIKSVLKIYMP